MKVKSVVSMAAVLVLAGVMLVSGCATSQNPYTPGTGLGAAVGTAIGAATNAKNPGRGRPSGLCWGAPPVTSAGRCTAGPTPLSPSRATTRAGRSPATAMRLTRVTARRRTPPIKQGRRKAGGRRGGVAAGGRRARNDTKITRLGGINS